MQNRHSRLISGIQEISRRDVLHSTKDLSDLIELHIEVFDDALKSSAMVPYTDYAKYMLMRLCILMDHALKSSDNPDYIYHHMTESSVEIDDGVAKMSFNNIEFNLYLTRAEMPMLQKVLISGIKRLAMRSSLLDDLLEKIYNDIGLQVLNDAESKKPIYSHKGRLIMPITGPHPYHVFRIFPVQCQVCIEEHIGIEQATQDGFKSIQDALDHSKEMPGSTAIAHNTQFYPLAETSLPIIMSKYVHKFRTHGMN